MMEEERSMREVAAASLVESRDPALIYEPRVREGAGGRLEILGKTENPSVTPWGFWGGALLAGLVLFLVFFVGSTGLRTFQDLFVFAAALIAGLAMFRLGRRSSLEEGLLCEIDLSRRLLSWPTSFSESLLSVTFDEVQEVVYGMIRYPVSRAKSASKVQAFTLLVRDGQGRLVPVVEASPNKGRTDQISKMLGEILGMPVTYVGLGIRDEE